MRQLTIGSLAVMAQWSTFLDGRLAAIVSLTILLSGCGQPAPSQVEAHPVAGAAADSGESPSSRLNDGATGQDSSATDEETDTAAALAELCQELFPSHKLQAVAMVFVMPDCPIANSYAPEYNRIHQAFMEKGIGLVLVYADPELDQAAMDDHARDFQVECPVMLDLDQAWIRRAGATVTPEAAVFNAAGRLLYRGRIDDRYAAVGKRRQAATVHDLRDALTAIAAGQSIPTTRTDAVGCH
ncbi:MAG: redoxin family protein, partial [Pirellulales bacterium]